MNFLEIDEIIWCIYTVINDSKDYNNLLILNKQFYRIYSKLVLKDINNKMIIKMWQGSIYQTNQYINVYLRDTKIKYVNSREFINKYLDKLFPDDDKKRNKFLTDVHDFIFNKKSDIFAISGNERTGKSFLKEIISVLIGRTRFNYSDLIDQTKIIKHLIRNEHKFITVCMTEVAYIGIKDFIGDLSKNNINYKLIFVEDFRSNNYDCKFVDLTVLQRIDK